MRLDARVSTLRQADQIACVPVAVLDRERDGVRGHGDDAVAVARGRSATSRIHAVAPSPALAVVVALTVHRGAAREVDGGAEHLRELARAGHAVVDGPGVEIAREHDDVLDDLL